jgi:hypothetical protein
VIWIAVAAVVVIIAIFAVSRMVKPDRLDEVDRFTRARQKTTGWANGEPPPEPVGRIAEDIEADHGEAEPAERGQMTR